MQLLYVISRVFLSCHPNVVFTVTYMGKHHHQKSKGEHNTLRQHKIRVGNVLPPEVNRVNDYNN